MLNLQIEPKDEEQDDSLSMKLSYQSHNTPNDSNSQPDKDSDELNVYKSDSEIENDDSDDHQIQYAKVKKIETMVIDAFR